MSSSSNSEKEISPQSSEVLEDVNKRVKDVFDILNRETDKVRKEMEALEDAAKKLEHVHFSKMLQLNVGGHLFSTSLETLNKDPGSMLHAMFSGRFDTKPAEDGTYFIDRDGTHFRYILNYLRTGQLIVPKDEIVREELLAEAEFYQVEGIIKALKVNCFKDSVILSSEQRETLVIWLKGSRTITNDSDKLLYRASRNGWAASNFHSCCDNKGPTVTVVKSGNYIFGGYTDQSWDELLIIVSETEFFKNGKPVNSTVVLAAGDFKTCGAVMGMSLLQGEPAPNFLAADVASYLVGDPLCPADNQDPVLRRAAKVVKSGLDECGILNHMRRNTQIWKPVFASGNCFTITTHEFQDNMTVNFSEYQTRKDAEITTFKFSVMWQHLLMQEALRVSA